MVLHELLYITISQVCDVPVTLSLASSNMYQENRWCAQHAYYFKIVCVIHISDPPGQPIITAPNGNLVENQTVEFKCSSTGGYPAPKFNWTRNGEAVSGTSGGSSESVLQVKLSDKDNGGNLTCTAYNELEAVTQTYTLDVKCKW